MTSHSSSDPRDQTIDVLRGIAVLLMILAHSIFFFHDGSGTVVNTLARFANTITLSIFIFISGMAQSKSMHRSAHLSGLQRNARILKYSLTLYLAYAGVSLLQILASSGPYISGHIVDTLLFVTPPNFTEYMPLFIFLPLLVMPLRHLIVLRKFKFSHVLVLSIASYLFGVLLYATNVPSWLTPIKELFAGGIQVLRFPLLFYLPIYIVGLWWESHDNPYLLAWTTGGALIFHIFSLVYSIPALSIDVRWPPSIGFILTGLSASILLFFGVKYTRFGAFAKPFSTYLAYTGKDALDFWLSHILLLFMYQKFIGVHSGNLLIFIALFLTLLCLSTIVSSIGITNTISLKTIGPVSIIPLEPRRFRKRYIALILFSAITIVFVLSTVKTDTLYGSRLPVTSFGGLSPSEQVHSISLSTPRKWHLKRGDSQIQLSLTALDAQKKSVKLQTSDIQILSGETPVPISPGTSSETTVTIRVDPDQFPTGTIQLVARYKNITSNPVSVVVSEPLQVAWTFDWEGWEVEQTAIEQLIALQKLESPFPFTHFVNPRVFLSPAVSQSQKDMIAAYLLDQQKNHNEIALHLHMQYDLIELAGVTPKKNVHWGLRSLEGYDVPTTQYSTEEFKTIVKFAKETLESNGFSNITGYRAGGWFISPDQLKSLHDLGFLYDSSGRDKPKSGAFKNIPWDLPLGAQVYYPDDTVQFMEIPNNGASTYEQSIDELVKRIQDVYTGGTLNKPAMLVFVSHPQFASREFSKIPEIIRSLERYSFTHDNGPVVFTRVSDIEQLWQSQ